MKILGIDYGTKRIGLAISDESLTLARELQIFSPNEFWDEINNIVQNEEVEKIIIGLPLNMSGEDSQKTVEARGFAEKVATITGVDVELVDERLSSAMAQNISGQKNNLDSLAAQIILQNYLDRQKSQNQN